MKLYFFVIYLSVTVRTENECINQPTCGKCIQFPDCIWLIQDPSQNTKNTGCYSKKLVTESEDLYNPSSSAHIIQNRPLGSGVRVSPQALKLKLRLNAPVHFNISTKSDEKLQAPLLDSSNSLNISIDFQNYKNNIFTTIEAKSCPRNQIQTQQTIYLTSTLSSQIITLEIQILCECPCENSNQIHVNSPKCNHKGDYQCGLCYCNQSSYGTACECPIQQNLELCKNQEKVCSGRGTCICNKCYCQQRDDPNELITGNYCECDNFSCPRINGQLCGGQEKGVCTCGSCHCKAGWNGNDCGRRTL